MKNEVKGYKTDKINGTTVAGGDGKGDKVNQLNERGYLVDDQDLSIYVSNCGNN